MLRARPAETDVAEAKPAATRAIRRRTLLWVGVPLGAVVLLGVIGLLAVGPIVRGRVAKEAARRRLDVDVGSVHPGFFAVRLGDVRVAMQGVPGVEARLDGVKVDLTAGFSVREVTVRGGRVSVDGAPEDVAKRVREFRKAGGGGESSGAAKKTPITVEDLALAWTTPDGEIAGTGLRFSRDDAGVMHASCTHFAAPLHKGLHADVTGGEIELGADGALRRVAADALAIVQSSDKTEAPAPPKTAAPAADPAPPPLPALTKGKPKPKPVAPAAPPVDDEPVLPLPDLHALRGRIGVAATALAEKIPDGTKVDIKGLSAKVDVGGEPVAVGPGPFTLERVGDRVKLAFVAPSAPSAAPPARTSGASEKGDAPGSTPLAIEAELPLAAGDAVAHLSGGPVSLAALGVKEGTKGLFDVAHGAVSGKGQLVLSAAGDALTFDGEIALGQISIKQPRLAPEPLRRLEVGASARGVLDDQGKLRIDDAKLDMGALHVESHGTLEETRDHFAVSLGLAVAPAACQAMLESAPEGLLPSVRAARMSGTFGATARVVFDTRTLDKLVLEYDIDDRCRMSEVPSDLSRDRFSGAFSYRTYHPDGAVFETTTGPGTPSWTELDDISPFMVAAVLTTEDGAFYRHHGFNHWAIKSSVAANLKARRFVRGASTITMQLAKNLFLSRDKNLSRKIEEVILTDYLEQVLRKDDMMELYLNVIEFGPDVYGITNAADYYFGRKPDELNLPECFFLASLLPSPLRYGAMRDGGELPEHWRKHLDALMQIAAKNGKITQAELDAGLAQPIVFVKPGDPRPEPRHPVTKTRRGGAGDDDAAWQPVD